MKPINLQEINNLRYAIQYFQDCYLVSSVGVLSRTENGRRILSENIAHTNDGFKIRFNNINGDVKDFFVTKKEMDDLVYLDKYKNPIEINEKFPHNPVIKAIEAAMNKLLEKYPSKKPWVCRIPECNEKFEFNKPSNFLEMFTGRKSIKINESSWHLSLRTKRRESIDLFDKIGENTENSFVAGSSINFYKGVSNNHCYTIDNIDKNKRKIDLYDHRFLKHITLTYEEAIKKLKFIVGYFDKDLI